MWLLYAGDKTPRISDSICLAEDYLKRAYSLECGFIPQYAERFFGLRYYGKVWSLTFDGVPQSGYTIEYIEQL